MPLTRDAAVDADDKASDLIVKVVDNAVSALLKYRNAATGHAFDRAIESLVASGQAGQRIEFYGVGNSGIVAQDAQHKFFRLQISTSAYADPHMQNMSAVTLGKGDVVVAISQTEELHATAIGSSSAGTRLGKSAWPDGPLKARAVPTSTAAT